MPLVLATAIALLIGLSLGAVGGGGSILAVPVLIGVAGLSVQQATTSSLVIVGTASLVGMVAHHLAGRVRVGAGVAFGLAGIGGALIGTRLHAALDPDVLLLGFTGVMLVVAARMTANLRRSEPTPIPEDVPGPGLIIPVARPVVRPDGRTWHDGAVVRRFADGGAVTLVAPDRELPPAGAPGRPRWTARRVALLVATGTGVGLLTGLFGVGGGFVIVPALMLVLAFPLPQATGTSLLVIAVNSAVALLVRGGADPTAWPVDWAVTLPFTIAAVGGVLTGRQVADRVPARTLTICLTALIAAVALWTGATAITALA
jgi:uncharacterized protein